jgi:hypothetical protein
MAKKKLTINWTYQGKEITDISQTPEGSLGFIYLIKNLSNGRFYIGRKSFMSTRKKRLTIKEKALPGNSRKTFKIEVKELPWKTYTGSCKPLNEDIKNGDIYTKEILRFCNSKKQLTYYELKELFCNNTIEREDCYNGNIMGKLFPGDLKN